MVTRHRPMMLVGRRARPLTPARIIHSHLRGDGVSDPEWPPNVVAAVWRAMSGDNVQRVRAVQELGSAGFPYVGPVLTSLLHDPEWDVRSAIVQALIALRGDGFPDGDESIMLAVVAALGDENSIVVMYATDFVKAVKPSSEVLVRAMRPVYGDAPDQIRTALGVVVGLSRAGDPYDVVATFFDGASLVGLIRSPDPEIRAEYLRALGAANQYVPDAWRAGLQDEDPGVHARALTALRWLEESPEAATVEPLLRDPDEGVRIETLFTLGHLGGYDRQVVAAALSDRSEKVRRYAAALLDS